MAKKTAFMKWIDAELQADPRLAHEVDELANEMKSEQEIVALREKEAFLNANLPSGWKRASRTWRSSSRD